MQFFMCSVGNALMHCMYTVIKSDIFMLTSCADNCNSGVHKMNFLPSATRLSNTLVEPCIFSCSHSRPRSTHSGVDVRSFGHTYCIILQRWLRLSLPTSMNVHHGCRKFMQHMCNFVSTSPMCFASWSKSDSLSRHVYFHGFADQVGFEVGSALTSDNDGNETSQICD